jgi:hypothetical protein
VCMYICDSTRTSFLSIFCVSCNVWKYVYVCFNFFYAKVYFVCHTMSVNMCVCCASILFMLKYVLCVIQCLYIYIYIYMCCASVFIVLILRVYVYMFKHYEKVLYIMFHACVCLYVI